ncbi:hypothetical protein LAJ19_00290 [Deinococcus taeanensis]|uniref:lipopolysaccharide biosynthesis protein n=1 Tax=Deinococcus taeanensis TaxID=2737050 RepID=UPI001CDC6191|nr:hypothetical protein [Deinococcus taeanensis]UBV42717.1 hypothetical protein LAJ19_00290 [Deinococcus taeanensis]
MGFSDRQLRLASRITFLGTLLNFGILTVQLLFLTPLLIRTVGIKVNGAWVGSSDLLLWLQAFDFGLTNYAIQKMSAAYAQRDIKDLSHWFSSTLIILLTLAVGIVVAGPLVAHLIYHPFRLSPMAEQDLKSAFTWGLWAVALTIGSYAFTGLARALQAPLMTMVSVVFGSILGIVISWWFLTHGGGVRSVAYGMFVRALVAFAGGAVAFAIFCRQQQVFVGIPSKRHLREGLAIMPYSGLGAIGYAVSNQSDNFLMASLLGPHVATQFNTMRRTADVARSIVETLGAANFAGFSHIFARDGVAGSRESYRRLLGLHSLLSFGLGGIFIVFNQWFMQVWLGPGFYLGSLINTLIALQGFLSTRAYLHNTMNRAMVAPQFAFVMLIIEAIVKLALVITVGRTFGVKGILIAGLGVATLSLMVMAARNAAKLTVPDSQWWVVIVGLVLVSLGREINIWLALLLLAAFSSGFALVMLKHMPEEREPRDT